MGFTLGMFTMLLVNTLQAAGQFVDIFAGFSLSTIYDPFSGAQSAVFGRFYQLVATTLLFTSNAYLILVNGFFRSFDVIPAGGLSMGTISEVLTKNMAELLVAAIEVAGPILACLFLAELTPRTRSPRRAEPQRVHARLPAARRDRTRGGRDRAPPDFTGARQPGARRGRAARPLSSTGA